MRNVIVIEGPDCSGKTTLAKFLAKQLNGIYFHSDMTKDLGLAMSDYQWSVHQNLIWNAEHLGMSVVFDRSWPSEVIYAQVIGPHDRINKFNYGRIQDLLTKAGARYIHADCESSSVRQLEDPDHPYSMMDFARIRNSYYNLFEQLSRSAPITMYDMDAMGHDMHTFFKENIP